MVLKRCVVAVSLAFSVVGLPNLRLSHALGDGPNRVESELFGLTVEWGDPWRAEEVSEDGDAVWIALDEPRGAMKLLAAARFGGDGGLCIAEVERRLESDPLVTNLQPASEPAQMMLPGSEGALFRMDAEPPNMGVLPWIHAVWCLTLQRGYSVLRVEVSGTATDFDAIVEAAGQVTITTTPGLAPPEFGLAAERDDLTSFWSQQFSAWGLDPYVAPSYVTFSAPVISGCGSANPLDMGFAYCNEDNAVMFETAMANDLDARYGRGINIFLLAHETGHHVAWLLGYTELCSLAECLDEINDVQFELMADCFAGAWMRSGSGRGTLSSDVVSDVLVAVADSFGDPTHGDSSMRLWWLLQGFHLGPDACFEPESE